MDPSLIFYRYKLLIKFQNFIGFLQTNAYNAVIV